MHTEENQWPGIRLNVSLMTFFNKDLFFFNISHLPLYSSPFKQLFYFICFYFKLPFSFISLALLRKEITSVKWLSCSMRKGTPIALL